MIRLRFVTATDPISLLIQRGEYGFWATHVEAVLPDGRLLGAHADGGVEARACDYDKGTRSRVTIVELPCTPEQEIAFLGFLNDQIGKPYDVAVIAQIALGAFLGERDWSATDHWICSELQAAALEASGWFAAPLASSVNHITPRDLLLIISGRVAVAA